MLLCFGQFLLVHEEGAALLAFLCLQEVTAHGLRSPTLILIGEVVALAPGWHLAQSEGCSLQDGRSYDPAHISSLLNRPLVEQLTVHHSEQT